MHQFIIYLVVQGNFFLIRHEGIRYIGILHTMKSAPNEFAFTFLLLPIYANSFYWLHAPSWFIMTRHSSNSFVQILTYLTLEVGMKLCNNEDKMRLLLWWRIKFFYTMYECRMVQSKMMIWRIFGLVKLILEFITTGIFVHDAEKTFTYV